MGWILMIAGVWVIATMYGNFFMLLLGIGMVFWGFALLGKNTDDNKGKKKKKTTSGRRSDRDYGGYDGPTHTGSGTPDHVYRGDGSYVNLHGDGWRESWDGGRENVYTGERVERDRVYGNYTYTDSDGDSDDRANFGYDSDD